jgi:hypothetical protein
MRCKSAEAAGVAVGGVERGHPRRGLDWGGGHEVDDLLWRQADAAAALAVHAPSAPRLIAPRDSSL